jgi:tetratricopeptide (TPR) repeat protein
MSAVDIEATTLPPALIYARLLWQSHELLAQNKGDTPEAEALAEQMDQPWYALTAQEQRRMRGLSADLHALREGGPKQVEMASDQLIAWQRAARDAFERSELGDADALLDFLRQPIPSKLPLHIIPFLQARCWEKLGDLETALIFMKEAERHDPEQTVSVLTLLQRLGRVEEAAVYAERIIARQAATPEELYLAACALLLPTRTLSDREAAPQLQSIIDVLERAQNSSLTRSLEQREIPDLDAWIAFGLGLCYERTGDASAALRTYSAALKRHPHESELLVARGLTLYLQNRPESLRDFLSAVRLGAKSIWPWHILARHALVEGAYGNALRYALQAAERAGPAQTRAEVHETIAIAQAKLGQPQDRVLENFKNALELDPENLRIRRNQEIALAHETYARASRDWRRSLTADRVDPRTIRQNRNQEVASQVSIIDEQRDARISNRLTVG